MHGLKSAQIKIKLAFNGSTTKAGVSDNATLDALQTPYLFSFPHSGQNYTQAFINRSQLPLLKLRSSEDAFVDQLFSQTCQNGGNQIIAQFPRAYVDVNRQVTDLDPELIIEPINIMPSSLARAGFGVIARRVSNQQNIYEGKLSLQTIHARLKAHYIPYHNALNHLTNQAVNLFGFSLLVDCHSMPSQFNPNTSAPDFIIGDLNGKSCNRQVSFEIFHHLKALGFNVKLNQPYAGGAITKNFSDIPNAKHSVQIEINRGLYMNEDLIEKNENFTTIQNAMSDLVQKITTIDTNHLLQFSNVAQ